MAPKQRDAHPSSPVKSEDLRVCKQRMRLLMGLLGQSLPEQQSALQSVLLMNFHRAAHGAGPGSQVQSSFHNPLSQKPHRGAAHHGRR